jgi:hypothetical protein
MNNQNVKKVHVVYKTHLDIGFTDLGQTVLDKYVKEYIPHAVNLAIELNTEENKKFIWTVGSFLIDYYFKHADEDAKKKLEEAINKGYICWHGIAVTTHTELMDARLFEYSLEIGKKLDERFKRRTIAAKMTDVPGHTMGIIEPMAKAGLKYIHIGVNASSMVPEVPKVFIWKHGDNELIVQYSSQYGNSFFMEGMEEILEFVHSGDNVGPQSAEEIDREFARIRELYPNARVEASTLDNFAQALLKIKDRLPVIEEEIGDTWIHGIASDPRKIGRYKALLLLKEKWLFEGRINKDSAAYEDFMMNLMLIPEHTWGLDFKKYLADFKNWAKEDFQKARREDITTLDFLTYRNAHMLGVLEVDFERYRNGSFTGSYSHYESSHKEQNLYIDRAVESLPQELKEEAVKALQELIPVEIESSQGSQSIGRTMDLNGWKVKIDGNGAIIFLEKNNRKWVKKGEAGKLQYEIFDAKNCTDNYYRYNRDFYETMSWSEGDFSKPGLEFVKDLEQRCYDFYVTKVSINGTDLIITLLGDEEASEKYGSPRKAQIIYTFFEETIKCRLQWFQKDANKMPEALWFKFQFDVENPNRWFMNKLGQKISPLNVVKGGNRKQHCVDSLVYHGADGSILIKNMHSPLVSIGKRNLYTMDHIVDNLENGIYFNLFNNRWGTNFKMWCEDDCSFEYELQFVMY